MQHNNATAKHEVVVEVTNATDEGLAELVADQPRLLCIPKRGGHLLHSVPAGASDAEVAAALVEAPRDAQDTVKAATETVNPVVDILITVVEELPPTCQLKVLSPWV